MSTTTKVALSVASFLVAILIAAAASETLYGEQLPGVIRTGVIVIEAPVLYWIWRPGKRRESRG